MRKRILKECSDRIDSIEVIYHCQFQKLLKTPGNDIYRFFNSSSESMTAKTRPPPPLSPRSGLRGGCVEVFNMVGKADHEYDVHYWDINSWVFFYHRFLFKHGFWSNYLPIFSLYPYICMQNKFVCGPSIHLKGAKMTSRLQLDQDSGMFLYHNPDNDTFQEVDGVMQIIIGVPRENRRVNQMPFLPMRISKGKDRMKAFRATCKKCVMERRKTLCTHNMLQVGAFFSPLLLRRPFWNNYLLIFRGVGEIRIPWKK